MNPTAPTIPTNPVPVPPVHQPSRSTALIVSLILGIVGLVANIVYIGFFITIPGMILLLLTVTMGIIGFTLALKTKRTVPPNKKRRAGIIINSISVGMAIISIGGFGVIYIASFLFTGGLSTSSAERQASVAQISEQKNFAANQTAHIGAWDVRITDVVRDYQPTATEYTPSTRPSSKLAKANEEFVLVKGSFTPNGKTTAVQTESGDPLLNNYRAVSVSKGAIGLWDSRVTSKTAADFTILFRIQKGSDTLTMTVPITIYKAVSPIVGTEGMPNEQVTYTLELI